MPDLTVIEDDFYPKLNIVVSSQYPSITISPPKNVLIGGGGGGQVGPRGIQGTQGPQGIQGIAGPIGPTGPQGDKYRAVSFTPLTVGSLTVVTLTLTESDLAYTPKQEVIVVSSSDINLYFIGTVISYSANSLQISVTSQFGSSSGNNWLINLFGLQGPAGETGAPGAAGTTGATGATGSISIGEPLFDTGTGITKTAAFTSGTEGLARKMVFLAQDGSLTFDYIRNYDVFNPTDLEFGIKTFTSNITSTSLIGSGSFTLTGFNISASYNPVGTPTVSGATLSISNGFGFPISLSSPYTSYTFTSGKGVTYSTAPQTVTLTLSATDGSTTDTETVQFTFVNNVYYGVSTNTNLTNVSSLTPILSNVRNRTFSVTSNAGEYIYYAYPSRLGTNVLFFVGGFEGGFNSGTTANITNSNGYIEEYIFYRSVNENLGSVTVTITNS